MLAYTSLNVSNGPRMPSDYVLSKNLAAGIAEAFVPLATQYPRVVVFASPSGFYANYTTTATVPGDVTDGSASEYIPAGEHERFLPSTATSISVISVGARVVTASFYRL